LYVFTVISNTSGWLAKLSSAKLTHYPYTVKSPLKIFMGDDNEEEVEWRRLKHWD